MPGQEIEINNGHAEPRCPGRHGPFDEGWNYCPICGVEL